MILMDKYLSSEDVMMHEQYIGPIYHKRTELTKKSKLHSATNLDVTEKF